MFTGGAFFFFADRTSRYKECEGKDLAGDKSAIKPHRDSLMACPFSDRRGD